MLDVLEITCSLISSSTALFPLADLDFIPHDLDIYLPSQAEAAMLKLLQFIFGNQHLSVANWDLTDSLVDQGISYNQSHHCGR
jgi:hypothetical protein